MATTYTSNLRIALPGTGENADTWGTVLNTNFGTLMESAVAGVASVALSDANTTLTANNGSADQSRCAVLVFSGTLTAPRDIIIPAATKAYIVKNDTAYPLRIRVSGQTGAWVHAGCTQTVWCDGTVTRRQFTDGWLPGDQKHTARASLDAGWLWCDGSAVSRTTYADLFAAIGTTYGTGDGSTTFNVPDLRGRALFGRDNMGGSAANRVTNAVSGIDGTTLGAAGGSESLHQHTHSATQDAHGHTITVDTDGNHYHAQGSESLGNTYGGGSLIGSRTYSAGGSNSYAGQYTSTDGLHQHVATASMSTPAITVADAGSGSSQNMPPAMICNVWIKV